MGFDTTLHKIRVGGRQPLFNYPRFSEDDERIEHDWPTYGCPKSWDMCRWSDSVASYVRRRVEGGMRVPNPRLDNTTDDLIMEAVLEYERAQDLMWSKYWRMSKE